MVWVCVAMYGVVQCIMCDDVGGCSDGVGVAMCEGVGVCSNVWCGTVYNV